MSDNTEATTEEKKMVKKEDHEAILSIIENIEKFQNIIGSMEVRKYEVISDIQNLRHGLEQKAKESLLNAGIAESDLEKYMVDIKNGDIVVRD